MVAALHVDHLVVAALPLGDVVRHVRHEIGIGAVGLLHHPVLVVAVVGGAQPQRAFVLIGLAGADQRFHSALDAAVGVERRLQVIIVEGHAKGGQVQVLLAPQVSHGEQAYRLEVARVAAGGNVGDAVAREEIAGDVGNIVAVIRIFRPGSVAWLVAQGARLHRVGQRGDLHAGVIVIELAGHVEPLRSQQRRHRVAQRALAAVAHMQRAGRVGRHELDQHALAGALLAAPVVGALLHDFRYHRLPGRCRQAQVDESWPGNFHRFHQSCARRVGHDRSRQRLGQLARVLLQRLGQLERDIAGDVAMGWVARALQNDVGLQGGVSQQRRQRGAEQGNDLVFLCG